MSESTGDAELLPLDEVQLASPPPKIVLSPGVYTDVPASLYHYDPCGGAPVLSASIAKILVTECPLSAWAAHPLLGGGLHAVSEAMERGTILDTLLAGGEAAFADLPYAEFRTNEAKAARDGAIAEGQIPMRKGQLDEWREKANTIRGRFAARGVVLSEYETQVTLVWYETATDGTPVLCKGRLDYLRGADIADLKTSEDLSDRALANTILKFGYHIQRAAYLSALGKLMPDMAGRHGFHFLFAEPTPAHATRCVSLDGMLCQLGRVEWQRAIDLWAQCLRTGQWPDYNDTEIVAPPWVGDRILAAGGSSALPF